jgi:hypothetical protein
MIGRRATLGLSLLSALLVCALEAQSALAIEAVKSKRTTAVTCVEKPGEGDFTDAHCDNTGKNLGKERFAHVEIKGETKEIAATNSGVTEETKKLEPAKLRGSVPGGKTELECEIVKSKVSESSFSNTEPEVGKHTISGTGVTEFSKCTVKQPLNCTLAEPIIARVTGHGVEGMLGPKGEKNAMGAEVAGEENELKEKIFAQIEYKGEKCSLKNQTFQITGRLIATNGPTTESAQENKESGATAVYTPKFNMQELKLGANLAEFEAITTVSMNGGNPLSATTTP